ncbi:High frequency lysogenization protein HflD [Photobacterium damselae subsp. piscicida]|uniref:High frequency lysogenization protein HflD homolog n=1 Tax=Photobacterium damsela subsp. piscicida TaxID=38294 RepID=A0A1V1V499_PHODP|nr:high frequency lysogenization protein HflD [Photobacterium damselae]MBE8128797.1 high frequency lysogenization protein HflD [Photobacterium damselae subsp. piscicida]MDP2514742.1 high frequency lysogenization protein HflD [Photobacterium damselae subsp. piscicida]MDP2532368.1 high frequency lysogenization protein HflD [Photobacterium damselae subsp. piscicida]MDP2544958.1 high frequency lysogenization protein HflD [Photobacterium damselae subsp. piscicida]MDP2557885.1 high frequency lysogen
MANTLYDRTIAFAGICQAVKLVQQVAQTGRCDNEMLTATLESILVTDPANTLAVYHSDEANLCIGLEALVKDIDNTSSGNELTRYLVGVMALERKLSGRRDSMAQLGDRIDLLKRQTEHFELLEEQMLSNIASVYLDIISPLGPRIQVSGTPAQLQIPQVQHKVRALLLAAIRSAVLWRQVGGKRRHLIFGRKQMVEQAKILLARC